MGHIDFVKRFLVPHVTPADLAARPGAVRADPARARRQRHGAGGQHERPALSRPSETYPSPAIVARFRELGGRAVTIGSDAHRADAFAWALDDGYESAAEAGFSSLTFRRGGERVEVELADSA